MLDQFRNPVPSFELVSGKRRIRIDSSVSFLVWTSCVSFTPPAAHEICFHTIYNLTEVDERHLEWWLHRYPTGLHSGGSKFTREMSILSVLVTNFAI